MRVKIKMGVASLLALSFATAIALPIAAQQPAPSTPDSKATPAAKAEPAPTAKTTPAVKEEPALAPMAPPPPPPPSSDKDKKAKTGLPLLKAAPPRPMMLPPLPSRTQPDSELVVAASPDGGNIFLIGQIREGSFQKFKKVADASPKATQVVLFSRGGSVTEASVMARYISKRGLNTAVDGICISACTQIFAAGKQRLLSPKGHMGFHAVRRAFSIFAPEPGKEVPKTGRMIYTMPFKDAGIDTALVDRAMKVPHSTVWYPTSTEMLGYRYVTKVGDVTGLVYPDSFGVKRDQIESDLLKKDFWKQVSVAKPTMFNKAVQFAWSQMVLEKKSDESKYARQALAQLLGEDLGNVADDALLDRIADVMAKRLKYLSLKERTFCNPSGLAPFNVTLSGKTDVEDEDYALMLEALKAPRKSYVMSEDEASEVLIGFFINLTADGKIDQVNTNSYAMRNCDTVVKITQGVADLTPAETGKLFRAIDSGRGENDSPLTQPFSSFYTQMPTTDED